MLIALREGCFEISAPPAWTSGVEKDFEIAKYRCGFSFDPVTGTLIGDAGNIDALRAHKLQFYEPVMLTKVALEAYRNAGYTKKTAIEMSHAADSNIVLPCPNGLAYLGFQRAGIEYAMSRSLVLIADEMGLGKTVQAIGVVNCMKDVRKVLIVCPASLKRNWRREWQKWDVKGLSVQIVDGTKPVEIVGRVVIINYDVLPAHRSLLKDTGAWDVMILDECHYLKNGRTERTLEVFGGIKRNPDRTIKERFAPIPAEKKLLLSGTPIVNKPKELWSLLQTLDPDGLGAKSNWYNYATRYCEAISLGERTDAYGNTYKLWKWDGASNLEELQEKLRERFMVRRLKKDVLTELPAKRRQVIVLEPDTKTLVNLIAREQQAYKDYEPQSLLGKPQPSIGEISKTRKRIAQMKVKYAVGHIKELLNETAKVVAFAHHHETLDALSAAFGENSVRIDGRVSLEERQRAVDRFQNDPTCTVFIGGIQAAGVGLTLTASSTVVFVELSWVPGEISQAEDRCHRIGQRESVLVQHLILEGSLDERVIGVVIAKQEIIDQALDRMS